MRAAFIAVGSELLRPGSRETNGGVLAGHLERYHLPLEGRYSVPDERDALVRLLEFLDPVPLVVLSGGLGPTQDDLTREALARYLAVPLVYHEELWQDIRAAFARWGREPTETNRRQAFLPEGAEPLPNPKGTACGVLFERGGKTWVCLPGVPAEFEAMLEPALAPLMAALDLKPIFRTTFRLSGCGESQVEENLKPFYRRFGSDHFTILAGAGEIRLHVHHADPDRFRAMEEEIRECVQEWIACEGEETLEGKVRRLLLGRGWTLAAAESCTGGAFGARLVREPGISAVFKGGVTAYADEIKTEFLAVEPRLLEEKGAVSPETALAMARGAARAFGTEVGVGITGIAGPDGGTTEKPVGTVCIAVSTPCVESVRRFLFGGDRPRVQMLAVANALDLLWRALA
jgi:nicotinamide-nucleotide amidase